MAPPVVQSPTDGEWFYKVVGVAGNDVLNIRKGPSPNYEIVGIIRPNGREILVEDRRGKWWLIQHDDTVGWVNSDFLARDYFCGPPKCDLPELAIDHF